jgi:superfamily II DNA or RNA helicase
MIVVTKLNESFLKITGDYEDLATISEYFTRYAPNYIWNPRYKSGVWDGKIRFFNSLNGQIPYGLIHELTDCVRVNDIKASWLYQQEPQTYFFDGGVLIDVMREFKKFNPHPHQVNGAKLALTYKRGILQHATSSGKTLTLFFILSYLLKRNPEKMIVVVPNKSLIKQFCANFEEYGMDSKLIGKYYGDVKDLTKLITVGTWQSLKKIPEFLKTVKIAIADEVHQAKAIEIKQLFENCTNAYIRLGVTGSLPRDECDLLSIIGGFGQILDTVKTDELIKANLVSGVEIVQINLFYPPDVTKSCKKDYHLEREIIQNDTRRMTLVRKLVERQKEGENILLLFDTLEFGERYFNYLKLEFPNKHLRYVAGDVSANEREEIRKFASENENVVIVASLGTFAVGIDIPRLHSVILLWAGKSDIRLKQSIGRGIRKHSSKDKVIIFDICDQLKYSKQHAGERLKVYFEEGFPIRTIEVGN